MDNHPGKRYGPLIAMVIIILVPAIIALLEEETPPTQRVGSNGSSISVTSQGREPQRRIPYEILRTWPFPGGGGKVILISPSYLNEADMRALGEQLHTETANEQFVVVDIFDDRRAATELRQALLRNLSEADEEFLDKHHVGWYHKDGDSPRGKFIFYLPDLPYPTNERIITY